MEPVRLRYINLLMDSPSKCPSEADNFAIRWAVFQKRTDLVRRLMEFPEVNPSQDSYALVRACYAGSIGIVRLLLRDNRVNPSAYNFWTGGETTPSYGSNLEARRMFAEGYSISALEMAASCGRANIVRLLLRDPRTHPHLRKNRPLRMASCRGHAEVVRLLLRDPRVNASDRSNCAIKSASYNGHVEVVRLLLARKEVDPSSKHNISLHRATLNGHVKVVRLLLQDSRVREEFIACSLEKHFENGYVMQRLYRLTLGVHLKTVFDKRWERVDSARRQVLAERFLDWIPVPGLARCISEFVD